MDISLTHIKSLQYSTAIVMKYFKYSARQSCQKLQNCTEELGLTRVNEFDVMSEIAGIWEETVSSPLWGSHFSLAVFSWP